MNIYPTVAFSSPAFPFAIFLHYSCTYWFVKQPINLDMEVGMTLFATANQKHFHGSTSILVTFHFLTTEKGCFIGFSKTRTSRYTCNLRGAYSMWLCQRMKLLVFIPHCLFLDKCFVHRQQRNLQHLHCSSVRSTDSAEVCERAWV